MELDNVIDLIGNIGFPIVITFYLLFRFERKIDELTETIAKLIKKL
ncbi:YvrJ family protein [Allobacillus sp. GCM10007491]|uniref:YvrJ family protein n=1 Tax=Allobacillus saliphilus TaxID=2912308 RepID=A0A941HUI8_9BACI|nr:YvrJ family protein [Allobacillus saliphilus]MBR7554935.1 YvrJ family protein [Allobacillus saliphilus]